MSGEEVIAAQCRLRDYVVLWFIYVTTGEGVRLRAGPLQSAVLEGQM